jgi:hypothetical protein
MRLTLRTLLAYLDDTLPPDEAKLIGQKVAESEMAQELVERIKKVTRRRSLANPSVQGDTSRLDPNTVAEYLDGELSGDDLSQTEQICLDDDVYLAEVAACHQILTLMLSEPARVPPPARQRIYRLVKGRESNPARTPPAYFPNGRSGRMAVADQSHRRANRAIIVSALIVLLAIGLIVAMVLAWPKSEPGQVAYQPKSQNPTNATEAIGETSKAPSQTSKSTSTNPAATLRSTEPSKNSTVAGTSKQPDDTKKSVASQADKDKSKPAETPTNKTPSDDHAVTPKKPLDLIPPDSPSGDRQEIGQFVSPDSILVQASGPERDKWRLVRANGRISSGVKLLNLPGFRDELKLDSGLQVSLWAVTLPTNDDLDPVKEELETRVEFHLPEPKFAADTTLDYGRVVFVNPPKSLPAKVRLRFRTEIWDLAIEPDSEILVDGISGFEPGDRFSKLPGDESPLSELYVSAKRGKVTIQIRERAPIELAAPPGFALLGWDSRTRLKPPAPLVAALPQWSSDLFNRAAMKDEFKAVLNGLVSRTAQMDTSIDLALKELAASEKSFGQIYAAYALVAIDDIGPVVDALDDLLKPQMRVAAKLAIQNWIGQRPENALALHQFLTQKKNFSESQADSVLQLLHPFSRQDLSSPETYEVLFRELADEKLAVRELALFYLARIDPDGFKSSNYNPVLPDGREAAIARWRKRLTDGKILPKPPKPMIPPEPKSKSG